MRWEMSLDNKSPLNTPVVNLSSPFSEFRRTLSNKPTIPAENGASPVPEQASKREFLGCSDHPELIWESFQVEMKDDSLSQNKRKRKTRDNCLIKCSQTQNENRAKKPKKEDFMVNKNFQAMIRQKMQMREVLALELQKAMIADGDGDRRIHIAVAQENVVLVKRLCALMKNAGLSVDVTNFLRQTPLHIAIIVGNNEIVKILLSSGASVHVQDRHGNNAILLAVKYFQQDTFCYILNHSSKSCLNTADYDGFFALHYAVSSCNAFAVNALSFAGADLNAVDGKSGRTALVHAVLAEHIGMVNLLIKLHACVDKGDYAGNSSIGLALQTGNRTIIRLLEAERAADSMCSETKTKSETAICCPTDIELPSVKERRRRKEKKASSVYSI